MIDAEFDAEQRNAVLAAVELWGEATSGRFAPELEFGPVACGDSFAIRAVATPGCSIGQKIETSEGAGRIFGATDPETHSVAVASWLDVSGVRDTAAHEIGHYLMLSHGDGIMAPRRERVSTDVAASSINEFCSIWGC